MLRLLAFPLFLALASCSSDARITQFAVEPQQASEKIPIPYTYVEMRAVSLPTYAEAEEIPILREDGSIRTSADVLWADTPERGITELLAANLSAISGAVVASEPWPLDALPQMRIEIRATRLLASEAGPLHFEGTWFAAPLGPRGRDLAQPFSIEIPFEGEGLPARAAAQSRAVDALARQIAKTLRR